MIMVLAHLRTVITSNAFKLFHNKTLIYKLEVKQLQLKENSYIAGNAL